jgi:hypothetical protein
MASWTGGRRRIKPASLAVKKTLIASPLLFTKRDKRGVIGDVPEWSETMLRQASKTWEEVLIFVYPGHGGSCMTASVLADSLLKFLEPLSIPNIVVIVPAGDDTETLTTFTKRCLVERGAKIKSVKNPREVTYMNLRKFIDAPHMHWAGNEDFKKAKIDLDKAKSFKDLQDERKARASWS